MARKLKRLCTKDIVRDVKVTSLSIPTKVEMFAITSVELPVLFTDIQYLGL